MFDRLKEICNYLIDYQLSLNHKNNDGRINSILNESFIIDTISKEFKIDATKSRCWADFFINDEPVNIKITTTNTADNASSKSGLYYALTGCYNNSNDWDNYLKNLSQYSNNSNKDYYFLVINKANTQDIFYNSLKSLNKITANGNNPPFQIQWCNNKIPVIRSHQESEKLLVETLGKSLELRANAYSSFKKYFKEYCI